MHDRLLAFIQRWLGSRNVGDTPENAGQCVGLVEVWLDVLKLPHIWGNAAQLLDNADPRRYSVVRNSAMNYPAPGDIICWNETWGGGDGHTAVVVTANVLHIAVFEQNDPAGAACLVATHDYTGVAGWIIPHSSAV